MEKFLVSTVLAFIVGPVASFNVIPTARELQKRTDQSSALVDDPETVSVSLDKHDILSVDRLQIRQCRELSVGAAQHSVKAIPTTPPKAKSNRHNKSVASASNETGLFVDAQSEALPFRCTAKDRVEKEFLMDWVCNAREPTKISVLRVAMFHSFVSAFQ